MCVVGCLLCYLYSSCQILCDVSGRLTRHSKHLHKITNRICGYSIAGRQGRSRNGPRVKRVTDGDCPSALARDDAHRVAGAWSPIMGR
jgi:hypothetical protein